MNTNPFNYREKLKIAIAIKAIVLMIILFIMFCTKSCTPPTVNPKPVDPYYKAIVTFNQVNHELDIHSSILAEYNDSSTEFDVQSIIPAKKGNRYSDTVILFVNLNGLKRVTFEVQQGYVVSNTFNPFNARIFYKDSLVKQLSVNGPTSDFQYLIYP